MRNLLLTAFNNVIFIILGPLIFSGCTLGPLSDLSFENEQNIVTPSVVKYSDNPQIGVVANRQYKHMTKKRIEEESELHAQAGSMWVPEGQGAYLFSQNKSRREGDLLNIKLDGSSLRQVEVKVNVIKKLIKQLEEETQQRDNSFKMASNNESLDRNVASVGSSKTQQTDKPSSSSTSKEEKTDLSEIQSIQTRIVEKLSDGNYRIKGQQPFMIDKKEYKVIMSGMIRPEDFSDEGVSSSKLIDSQIDVVSIRRGGLK